MPCHHQGHGVTLSVNGRRESSTATSCHGTPTQSVAAWPRCWRQPSRRIHDAAVTRHTRAHKSMTVLHRLPPPSSLPPPSQHPSHLQHLPWSGIRLLSARDEPLHVQMKIIGMPRLSEPAQRQLTVHDARGGCGGSASLAWLMVRRHVQCCVCAAPRCGGGLSEADPV